MKTDRYFTIPMAIIPLAVISYARDGNWKMSLYWLLVAAINGVASSL